MHDVRVRWLSRRTNRRDFITNFSWSPFPLCSKVGPPSRISKFSEKRRVTNGVLLNEHEMNKGSWSIKSHMYMLCVKSESTAINQCTHVLCFSKGQQYAFLINFLQSEIAKRGPCKTHQNVGLLFCRFVCFLPSLSAVSFPAIV